MALIGQTLITFWIKPSKANWENGWKVEAWDNKNNDNIKTKVNSRNKQLFQYFSFRNLESTPVDFKNCEM